MRPTTKRVLAGAVALLGAAAVGAFLATIALGQPSAPPNTMTEKDIGFAQDMMVHHQQAVTMADMVAIDTVPEVRQLADQIRFVQLREIGIMSGWLQISGAQLMSSRPMAWMTDTSAAHAMDHGPAVPATAPQHVDGGTHRMPGMATSGDLVALQGTTGRANEILFLQLMLRHHQGGIDMAAAAVQNTRVDAIRDTGRAMLNEQAQEIQLMSLLLQERGAKPLPYP